MQLESSRIDGAPEYLRLISTPTTLEREIGVSRLDVYLETYYRSGFYNRGSRRASPGDIRLQE